MGYFSPGTEAAEAELAGSNPGGKLKTHLATVDALTRGAPRGNGG
jgi:hypothetical protein